MTVHPISYDGEITTKPWEDWSLEERRLAITEVNTARRILNNASAVWLWGKLGLPMPPRHLLPPWWQSEMFAHQSLPSN